MTSRVLPPAEWPRLVGTEAEALWPHLDPARAFVLVVEAGDRIVACAVFLHQWFADCLWLHPAYRQGGVTRQLWRAAEQIVRDRCDSRVVVPVIHAVIRRFFQKVGARRLPAEVFVWDLKQPPSSRSAQA